MNQTYYLGVDIGGTKCAIIAGTEEMKILSRVSFPTETYKGPWHAINLLSDNIMSVTGKLGISGLEAVGISCGGPLDSKRGIVQSPPNLPGWDNIPIVQLIKDKLKVPVYLQNDANACALAEWKFGAGRGTRNMVFLTFGTGMGAGIIIDGKLYSGTNDLAGEVGHIRLAEEGPEAYGKKGSFEGFCSGTGIALLARRIARERLDKGLNVAFCDNPENISKISARDVAEAAERGDEVAAEIFKVSGSFLGKGLSVIIDILNPEMIVIGSIYTRCRKFLEPSCLDVLQHEALTQARMVCRIEPAALGEEVGDFASLSVAMVSGK